VHKTRKNRTIFSFKYVGVASCKFLFDASVMVVVSDGQVTLFLSNRWINGCSIRSLGVGYTPRVPALKRKDRLLL
jgi:hypothetical protein